MIRAIAFVSYGTMPKTTLETLDELLRSVQGEVDDSDAIYRLRSARQLVQVLKQRHDDLDGALDESIDDEEVLENLRDLGYL